MFICRSGLGGIQDGAFYPADILLVLRLSLGHRPHTPVIPRSDNDLPSLGYWPSSSQCLITLGNILFACIDSQSSVKSEFATSYLHCHHEDISSKINVPEQLFKRSKRGTKRGTLLCISSC